MISVAELDRAPVGAVLEVDFVQTLCWWRKELRAVDGRTVWHRLHRSSGSRDLIPSVWQKPIITGGSGFLDEISAFTRPNETPSWRWYLAA